VQLGPIFLLCMELLLRPFQLRPAVVPLEQAHTVCQFERGPRSLGKAKFRVTAILETDYRHSMVLRDPGCPSVLVPVVFAPKKRRHPSVDSLLNASRALPRDYETDPMRFLTEELWVDVSGELLQGRSANVGQRFRIDRVWSFERRRPKESGDTDRSDWD
jgi:hypothetical protein